MSREGSTAVDASLGARLREAVRTLDPAYFGLVMSTGIISLAFRSLGIDGVAVPLAVFNVAVYAGLLVATAARVGLFPGAVHADLRDADTHWGTLTFIVGTNTVGAQLVQFFGLVSVATALWLVTVLATPALLYYLFVTEFVGSWPDRVAERIDGAFLLTVVCMQSLAILGGLLSDALPGFAEGILVTSMAYWGAGFMLYLVVVTVVTYRLLDGALAPADWTGPYWITMGAAAITTLAGSTLGPRLVAVPALEPLGPATLTVTFLAWAAASWWIPLLVILDVWKFTELDLTDSAPAWVLAFPWLRLGIGRRLHTYEVGDWGRVFPMGMYTACTLTLAGVETFTLLSVIPRYWGWFALVVWALTMVGTGRAAGRVLAGRAPAGERL